MLTLNIVWGCFWFWLRQKGYWFKKSIRGEHALVTGGARGIGRAIALELAKNGAKVTVTDMQLEATENNDYSSGRPEGAEETVK